MSSKQDTIRRLRDEAADCVAASKLKKAAELYDELVRLEPSSGDWARRGADCYRQLGKAERQLELLLQAARAYKVECQLLKAIAMGKLAERAAPGDGRVALLMQDLSSGPTVRRPGFIPPQPARRLSVRPSRPAADAAATSPIAARAPAGTAAVEPPAGVAPEPFPGRSGAPAPLAPAQALADLDLRERLRSVKQLLPPSLPPESEGIVLIDIDDILIEELAHVPEHENLEHLGEHEEPAPSRATALNALGSAELFGELEPEQLECLVERVQLVELAAQETLFGQGDAADSMYVVAWGEVAALATDVDSGVQVELARLGSGQFFGEIGLLSNQPRQAGIVATEDTLLLCFPREVIMALVEEDPKFLTAVMRFLRLRLVETLMLTSSLFLPFGPEDRATLQRLFRFLDAEEGTVVVAEGKRSDGLYVMVTGQAAVLKGTDEVLLGLLGPGDVFGEMSLLQQKPATASVILRERAFLLRLPDRYFMEVLMMHPALMEYVATLGATRAEQNAALLRQGSALHDDHVALF